MHRVLSGLGVGKGASPIQSLGALLLRIAVNMHSESEIVLQDKNYALHSQNTMFSVFSTFLLLTYAIAA